MQVGGAIFCTLQKFLIWSNELDLEFFYCAMLSQPACDPVCDIATWENVLTGAQLPLFPYIYYHYEKLQTRLCFACITS